MSADLHKARELFLHAVGKLPPAKWESYVKEGTHGDAELEQQVHHLLKAHLEAGSFLQLPAVGPQTSATQPIPGSECSDSADSMIGPYKLLEQIGEGGMGTVWMAQQTEPIKRLAAVKLIKPGMNSKIVLARFEGERQALALMDHPHIARVFDAGSTSDGRPYFVMELVKGVPITDYCDAHRLTPRQRLELFIPVCQAIQHAHQKGIIHRDLKPSNVLVALYDEKPVPKVIDFGVAKAIGPHHNEGSLHTGFGDVVGTVEYMSPEQATLNQLDVDTRSDIYSLGILLYELLAGSPPFSSKELKKASLLEVLRVIREQEPSKPSTKLSTAEGLPTLAANRGTEPKRLTALVRGELDWIVMKALEKDRNRRYETADRFAVDLQSYLSNQPVLACPPSRLYRLRKSLLRNKGIVLAVAAVLLALLAGVAGTTWGMVSAQKARAEESILRRIAEQNESKAKAAVVAEQEATATARDSEAETKAVLEFVESKVFASARPKGQEGGLGPEVTLRKAIDASVPFVENSFLEKPLIEAQLRMTLGRSYSLMGEWNKAAEQYQKARMIYTKQYGPNHLLTVKSISNLATCYYDLGRYDDSLPVHLEALSLRKSILGAEHVDTIASMINVGNGYAALGRNEQALQIREETLSLAKKHLGANHVDTLLCMSNLSNTYAEMGMHHKALEMRELTLVLRKAHPQLGPQHPDTLRSMNNLAVSFSTVQRHAEAYKLREEVLALRKTTLGVDHPDTLNSMHNLSFSLAALGRHVEALQLREETLKLTQIKHGLEHPATFRAMMGLALSYSALGRHAEALKLHQETLSLRKTHLKSDHPDTLQSMFNTANTYIDLGQFAEALKLHQETFALRKAKLGLNHPSTLQTMKGIAASLVGLNRDVEAIPLVDECLNRVKENVTETQVIPGLLELRLKYFEKLKDVKGCQETARIGEEFKREDADYFYALARCRAVTAGLIGTTDKNQAEIEALKAIHCLRQAASTSKMSVDKLSSDKDFDALHKRDDFKKLLAELKGAEKY